MNALKGTALADIESVVASALAAERILDAATIVYVREGDDAIRVHIKVRSLSEAKKQCARIARQLPKKIGVRSTARADIFVRESVADERLIVGERLGLWSRLWDVLSEKLVSKIVPSAITLALVSYFMVQRDPKISAAIGLGATLAGFLVEAVVLARKSSEWKWKELS